MLEHRALYGAYIVADRCDGRMDILIYDDGGAANWDAGELVFAVRRGRRWQPVRSRADRWGV